MTQSAERDTVVEDRSVGLMDWLRGLPAPERERLEGETELVELEPDVPVFSTESSRTGVYLVLAGCVGVEVEGEVGRIELAELDPGSVFSGRELLAHALPAVRAVAKTEVQLRYFPEAALGRLTRLAPAEAAEFYRRLFYESSQRLRSAHCRTLLYAQERATLREQRAREGDLVDLIVHDLRSPLSVATTGAQQLTERSERYGPLTSKQQRVLQRVMRGHAFMSQLLDEVLEVGRAEGGGAKQEPTTVEEVLLVALPQCLQRFRGPEIEDSDLEDLKALSHKLASQAIHIVVEDCLAKQEFVTDSLRVVHVLMNLFGNAMKYAPGWVEVRAVRRNDFLRFAVADRGEGISPEYVSRVFDRYEQVAARSAGVSRGFGIGLTGARQLVESLGGRIWLESEVGAGSTFYVEIPFKTV